MVTKGYGLTIKDIDQSCPADLEPYNKAHEKELIEQDALIYSWWGVYGTLAVETAIDQFFNGYKAKTKYIEEPLFAKDFTAKNGYKESQEEVAVYEMKQRIKMLKQKGLPESPM